tara:strand:- start:5895 stop:6746 length:852 start_codon:yes stop_codon:yes gene_type:complete
MKKSLANFALAGAITLGSGALEGCEYAEHLFPDSKPKVTRESLSTNTLNISKEGMVNINEDAINFQKVGLLGDFYFVIPLNTSERVLKGGEPSFGLVPESMARISVTQVGEKGGKVIVDAPEGDLYLPYGIEDASKKLVHVSNKVNPARLTTNFDIRSLKKPNGKNGKINLERMSEQDLPFSDETLKTLGNQGYIVNKAGDLSHKSVLPIYFTSLPLNAVEYNRAESDGKIRIVGSTYIFQKGLKVEDYANRRGFVNPIKDAEKNLEKRHSVTMDQKQPAKPK